MKLVSKFKDYYDGALAYGRDENIVYLRLTEEIQPVDFWASKDPALAEAHARYWSIPVRHIELPNYRTRPEFRVIPNRTQIGSETVKGMIAFCGKLYPFVHMQIKNPAKNPQFGEENIWVHSFDKDFDKYVEIIPRWQETSTPWASWVEWFAEHIIEDASLNLHLNSPIVSSVNRVITVNPCLKDYHFQKIVDPYTAFQEISMFISGVLSNNIDPPDIQTDKAKVVSHGFDPKYGFRKPPQTR